MGQVQNGKGSSSSVYFGIANLHIVNKKIYVQNANEYIYYITGYSKEEFIELSHYEIKNIIYKCDVDNFYNIVLSCTKIFDEANIEFRIIKKDGSKAWFFMNGIVIKNENNNIDLRITIRDITEYKSEGASKLEMETLLKTIPGGVARVALCNEFNVLYANDGFYELTGYSREEYQRQPISGKGANLIVEEDIPAVEAQIEEKLYSGKRLYVEYRIKKKDNSIVWISVNASPVEVQNGIPIVQAVFTDITDSKTAVQNLTNIANNIPGGIAEIICDDKFTIQYASDGFYALSGYTREEYHKYSNGGLLSIVHEEDRKKMIDEVKQKLALGQETIRVEYRIIRKDRSIIWKIATGSRISDKDGYPVFQCIFMDDTIAKEYSIEVQKSKAELEGIINTVPGGVAKFTRAVNLVYASKGYYEMTGYTVDEYNEFLKQNKYTLIHPDDIDGVIEKGIEQSLKGDKLMLEYRIIKKNGDMRWIMLNAQCDFDAEELVVQCVFTDITNLKYAYQMLKYEQERYRVVSEQSNNVVFEYSFENDSLYCSSMFKEIFGYEFPKYNIKKEIFENDFIFEDDKCKMALLFEDAEKNISYSQYEIRMKKSDGSYIWVLIGGSVIYSEDKNIKKGVGKIVDINNEKLEKEGLIEKSKRDALTKLYNKESVKILVGESLKNSIPGTLSALMVIDIDNFKAVNDNLGHLLGDDVLAEISHNLQKIFRSTDVIGRVGGDEFLVFISRINDKNTAEEKADLICQVFRDTYMGDEGDYKISGSVGIAISPEHGSDFTELFRKADIALYRAKGKGKDTFEMYE